MLQSYINGFAYTIIINKDLAYTDQTSSLNSTQNFKGCMGNIKTTNKHKQAVPLFYS